MDANQTRFHLLLGQDDWARSQSEAGLPILESSANIDALFSWDVARSLLTLGARLSVFHSSPAETPPSLDDRRGAAQDRFGNWYWIADSRTEILVNSSGTSVTTHFWSSNDESPRPHAASLGGFGDCPADAPRQPLAFAGLTITTEHYLVVGVAEPAGFVVFDLFHGGPPRQFIWPTVIPFEPFDMAAAPGGGVWILDRINRRVWALDRTFAVIRNGQQQSVLDNNQRFFLPADGSAVPPSTPRLFPDGLSLEWASPLLGIDAVSIESLPDGTFLVLETDPAKSFSLVYRFRFGQQLGTPVSTKVVRDLLPIQDRPGFQLLGHDFAFLASESGPAGIRSNILYIASVNGDQSWAFLLGANGDQLTLKPLAEYYPMRLFGGKGLVAGQTQAYYDFQDRWIPLVMQRRPRYVEEAALITKVFDGKEPDVVWHRLMMDACIPGDTAIQVQSRSNNDPDMLAVQDWQDEPGPYMRGDGIEIPWTTVGNGLETWELLFQRATGRYLQLKLTFSGNGRSTPRIRALRAYYPRFSYLTNYLPRVYRQDPVSASFLDRFLSNTEGFFTAIEDRVATVQALFDVASAPADALEWLANWFGVALDPSWTEAKQRLFLQNATQFFEARGTIPGLLMALRLTLEDCADQTIFDAQANQPVSIRIVEKFRNRRIPVGMLQNNAADPGLPVKLQTTQWTPAQGAADLNNRYQQALQLPPGTTYSIWLQPSDANYKNWQAFAQATLGFSLSAAPDPELWQAFLVTRYFTISALNTAYGANFTSFDAVALPASPPLGQQALVDWYEFQGTLLIRETAHQFTVFLPMPIGDATNTQAARAKLDLAQRVLDLEKPAHATYEIKFYWAFFRVGDARLGQDTVLDAGSRAPQLLSPVVLGDSYVGGGYLSRDLPGSPRERPFLKQGGC